MFLISFSALRLKYSYDAAGCLIWINDDISSYINILGAMKKRFIFMSFNLNKRKNLNAVSSILSEVVYQFFISISIFVL
jgi:hypothetical protein